MPCGGHFTQHGTWFLSRLIPALISDALIIVNIISHRKVFLCLSQVHPKNKKLSLCFVSFAAQKEIYMKFLSSNAKLKKKNALTFILDCYLRKILFFLPPALLHLPKSRLIECVINRLIVLFFSNALV